jgi:hypothetical protein
LTSLVGYMSKQQIVINLERGRWWLGFSDDNNVAILKSEVLKVLEFENGCFTAFNLGAVATGRLVVWQAGGCCRVKV